MVFFESELKPPGEVSSKQGIVGLVVLWKGSQCFEFTRRQLLTGQAPGLASQLPHTSLLMNFLLQRVLFRV